MFNASQLSVFNSTTHLDISATVPDTEPVPDTAPASALDTEKIVLSVILSIFCVLGTVGNALAFLIYYRKREKGTSTIFILSLAVTDFLTCLINLPYTIISLLLDYRLEYDIVCQIFLYIGTFNVPLSSLIMVAIGIDRYFCICHPFLHVVTVPRAKVCVIVLTFLSALLGIVPALSHSIYRQDSVHGMNMSNFSLLPASVGALTTSAPWMSSTTQLYINGLFLEPDSELLKDLVRQEAVVTYKAGKINIPSSIATSITTPPLSNATLTSSTTNLEAAGSTATLENLEGVCVLSEHILSARFVFIYQYVYAGTYLFDFIVLAILYALIYRSILVRRALKSKRKRMSNYASTRCPDTAHPGEETQLTNINGTPETVVLKKNSGRFSSVMRDRTLHANVKTAAMLFVVTLGFIISFLPSWLMGLRIMPLRLFVFYMFYINNVINPFIYAFMNRMFRDDLFQLLKSCFRR